MRHSIRLCALFLVFSVTAAAGQQDVVVSGGSSYSLRPGDVIRISVWGQDDYSGQFQVDENGRIQYPLVGEIDLEGRTVADVRDEIRRALGEIFNRPFVTITPLFRIAVLGEVQAPGLLTVDPTLSVLDVVAMAGGPTTDGNINKIRLLRQSSELQLGVRTDRIGGQTLQEIGIRSGDQVFVPQKALTTTDWLILIQLAQLALSVGILVVTL
jgi:polysaccharide export outer membrane protein